MQIKHTPLVLSLLLFICNLQLQAQLNDYDYHLNLAKQSFNAQRYDEALLAIIEADYSRGANRAECGRLMNEILERKTQQALQNNGPLLPLDHYLKSGTDPKAKQKIELFVNKLTARLLTSLYVRGYGEQQLALARYVCAITNNQNIPAFELRSEWLTAKSSYMGFGNPMKLYNSNQFRAQFQPGPYPIVFYAGNDRIRAIDFQYNSRYVDNEVPEDLRSVQQIQHLSFSPSWGNLLVCENTGNVKIHHVQNQSTPTSTVPTQGKVNWASFLSDNNLVATTENHPGQIDFYRLNEDEVWAFQKSINLPSDAANPLRVVVGSAQFLAWGKDSIAHVFNEEGIETTLLPLAAPILNGTLTKDGSKIALQLKPGSVYVFDKTGLLKDSLTTFSPLTRFSGLTFSPDGRYLLAGSLGELYAWDLSIAAQNRYPFITWRKYSQRWIGNIVFSTNGKKLFWLDESGAYFWTNFENPDFNFYKEIQPLSFRSKMASGFMEESDCFCTNDISILSECSKWFKGKVQSNGIYTTAGKLHLLYANFFAERAVLASPTRQNSAWAAEMRISIRQIDGYFLGTYFPEIPPPTQDFMIIDSIYVAKEEDNYAELMTQLNAAKQKGILNDSIRQDIASSFLSLAWRRIYKQDYPGAVIAAEKGLQIDPSLNWGLSRLALAYLLKGDWSKAEKIYTTWQHVRWEKSGNWDLMRYTFFNEYFAEELRILEIHNFKHPDFAKLRHLLHLAEKD